MNQNLPITSHRHDLLNSLRKTYVPREACWDDWQKKVDIRLHFWLKSSHVVEKCINTPPPPPSSRTHGNWKCLSKGEKYLHKHLGWKVNTQVTHTGCFLNQWFRGFMQVRIDLYFSSLPHLNSQVFVLLSSLSNELYWTHFYSGGWRNLTTLISSRQKQIKTAPLSSKIVTSTFKQRSGSVSLSGIFFTAYSRPSNLFFTCRGC